MGRFFVVTFLLLIAGGLLLYHQVESFWIHGWLGKLPGDTTVIKDGIKIYFPFTSAFLFSSLIFTLVWLFRRKKQGQEK